MNLSLVIDARPLARGTGGIQRYLKNLLPYLTCNDSFKLTLYSDHPIDISFLNDSQAVKIRYVPLRLGRSLSWHLMVCIWAAIDKPDVFWSPRHHLPFILPNKTKRVVTIHDFVWKTWPETMPKLQRSAEWILMPFSLKTANHIICISQTTQSQFRQFFPGLKARSTVILHGADIPNPRNETKIANNPGYFLAVGTLEPRKNYQRLITAFDEYVKNEGTRNLIIVGKNGWGCAPVWESIEKSKNAERIEILQTVSDDKLSELYSNARGFISPSLDEGYGLPPQEAMNYKLPLLLSDIDVYRELYPSANLWVDPLSITELALGLQQLEKIPKGKTIDSSVTKYGWADCAKMHIDVLLSSLQTDDIDPQ